MGAWRVSCKAHLHAGRKVSLPNPTGGELWFTAHLVRLAPVPSPLGQGQGPCSLIVSLKSSPSERKGGVVPSIAFRNTSRSDCCAADSAVAIVVIGGKIAP